VNLNRTSNITSMLALILTLCLVLAPQAQANPLPNPKANPADPQKVLRLAFPVPETGFDPVRVNDLYSNTINAAIFQPLVTYDWMAMPTRLVPDAAEAMPEISKDGKHTLSKLKKACFLPPTRRSKVIAEN